MRGAQLQGANLRKANLQGVNLVYANLQGTDLSEAELQGAKLRETQLQGSDWTNAKLDGAFIADSSWSDWDDQRQRKLEARLKQMLDDERFNAFQARMKRADADLSPGKAASQKACYSDNRALLKCEYDNPAQLKAYRTRALHPALIELACSDASIASQRSSIGERFHRSHFRHTTQSRPFSGSKASLRPTGNSSRTSFSPRGW